MKHLINLTLCFLCILSAEAQQFPVLQRVLQSKDVRKLNDYSASNSEVLEYDFPATGMYWRQYREVLPGYYEGTMQIYYGVPKTTEDYVVIPYRIQVLVKDSTIIQYALKAIDQSGRYRNVSYQERDSSGYKSFVEAFNAFYKVPLDERFLFIDSLNYGEACGDAEAMPAEMKIAKEYIATKDEAALLKWLQTGNTELQFYAIYGFSELAKQQITPGTEAMRLISFVLNKAGNVNICTRTHERTPSISSLKDQFSF